MEDETNQLCVINVLMLQYGIVTPGILLHLFLSWQIFAVPPKESCRGLHIFCGHKSGREKQAMRSTVNSVGVWNRNMCYLAPPIPISTKFLYPL